MLMLMFSLVLVSRSVKGRCLSSGINTLAGGRRLPPEILPPGDLPSPVNGILWQMSELITQERIAVGPPNLVEGLTT